MFFDASAVANGECSAAAFAGVAKDTSATKKTELHAARCVKIDKKIQVKLSMREG